MVPAAAAAGAAVLLGARLESDILLLVFDCSVLYHFMTFSADTSLTGGHNHTISV